MNTVNKLIVRKKVNLTIELNNTAFAQLHDIKQSAKGRVFDSHNVIFCFVFKLVW